MKLSSTLLAFVAVFAAASPASAEDPVIRWDPSRAIVHGTGCQKDVDAFILENGPEVAVVFSGMGMRLALSEPDLVARKNCRVVVPATMRKGFYIGRLEQTADYGIVKTVGPWGALGVVGRYFGEPLPNFDLNFPPPNAYNNPAAWATVSTEFQADSNFSRFFCDPSRSNDGLYQGDFAVSAIREDSNGDGRPDGEIILFIDGVGLKYTLRSVVSLCPKF